MENNQKTEPDSCFDGYGLSGEITETLTLLGYEHPTRVQEEVLPYVLAGRNVVVRSQTGTGKTAAFAIPVCEQIVWEENLPQALVLEPSRELAVQVSQEIFRIGRKKRLKVPAVFGGFPIDKQIQTLRQKTHIVVGTPGRVMDHVRRGSLKLTGVRYLVIDEADLMLDMGFMDEVRQIVGLLPEKRQTLLFSATLDEDVKNLETETESYYFWAGMLDNQTPSSAMGTTGLGAVIALLGLFILSSMLKKHHVAAVRTFLDSHKTINRERLDEDFRNARKISGTFWIGEDLTYGIVGKPVILVNQELKKVRFQVKKVGRGTSTELVCVMADGKEYEFTMNRKDADEAIALYHAKFPALKMASSLKGKLMVPEDGDTESN